MWAAVDDKQLNDCQSTTDGLLLQRIEGWQDIKLFYWDDDGIARRNPSRESACVCVSVKMDGSDHSQASSQLSKLVKSDPGKV
jgi:hypothetical protein